MSDLVVDDAHRGLNSLRLPTMHDKPWSSVVKTSGQIWTASLTHDIASS